MKWLTKLDLNKGFHQIKLTKRAQERCAVVTPQGKFIFKKMLFGLVNATATFQRLMDIVLKGAHQYSRAYIDNILVYSETWEEHLQQVEHVLQRLGKAGLTTDPSK